MSERSRIERTVVSGRTLAVTAIPMLGSLVLPPWGCLPAFLLTLPALLVVVHAALRPPARTWTQARSTFVFGTAALDTLVLIVTAAHLALS